jgi:hypothetical protein
VHTQKISTVLSRESLVRVWNSLGPWKRVALSIFAIISIFTTHYIGFLSNFPREFRDVVGNRFASSFLTTFFLYSVSAIALARITAFVVGPVLVVVLGVIIRITNFRKTPFAREYVRMHRTVEAWMLKITVALALYFLIHAYCLPKNGIYYFYVIGGFACLALLTSFPRIPLKPLFRRRISGARAAAERNHAIATVVYVLIGTSVALSFSLGLLRFHHEMESKEISIATQCASLNGRLFASNEDEFLIVTGNAPNASFILVGKKYIIMQSTDALQISKVTCSPK